jgi:predicted nucleic acid-binding protein
MPVLADTTVWALREKPTVGAWLDTAILLGEVAICEVVALEVLFSAQGSRAYREIKRELEGLPWLNMDGRNWNRAMEVQQALADHREMFHRSAKVTDLLIASAAELSHVPLFHYDHDFERIGEVTGQETHWVVERGTVDSQ